MGVDEEWNAIIKQHTIIEYNETCPCDHLYLFREDNVVMFPWSLDAGFTAPFSVIIGCSVFESVTKTALKCFIVMSLAVDKLSILFSLTFQKDTLLLYPPTVNSMYNHMMRDFTVQTKHCTYANSVLCLKTVSYCV